MNAILPKKKSLKCTQYWLEINICVFYKNHWINIFLGRLSLLRNNVKYNTINYNFFVSKMKNCSPKLLLATGA